jgi:hypothetical protein
MVDDTVNLKYEKRSREEEKILKQWQKYANMGDEDREFHMRYEMTFTWPQPMHDRHAQLRALGKTFTEAFAQCKEEFK